MKIKLFLCFTVYILLANTAFAQTPPQITPSEALINMSDQMTKVAKSVESMNARLKFFSETFTSNQGIRLSEKQQQLLFAFELLNRAEQSIAVLQKLKIDLTEKKISTITKLSRNEDESRTESIDRSLALRGTTNAEELREIKRRSLIKERGELTNLLNDIQIRLSETNQDIRQTEMFIKRIRNQVYSESEKELKDF
jgi:hypothetical protein